MAHNGEKVEISGGIPLKISSWQPYQVDKTETIQLVPNANNVFHRTNVGQNTTTIRFASPPIIRENRFRFSADLLYSKSRTNGTFLFLY